MQGLGLRILRLLVYSLGLTHCCFYSFGFARCLVMQSVSVAESLSFSVSSPSFSLSLCVSVSLSLCLLSVSVPLPPIFSLSFCLLPLLYQSLPHDPPFSLAAAFPPPPPFCHRPHRDAMRLYLAAASSLAVTGSLTVPRLRRVLLYPAATTSAAVERATAAISPNLSRGRQMALQAAAFVSSHDRWHFSLCPPPAPPPPLERKHTVREPEAPGEGARVGGPVGAAEQLRPEHDLAARRRALRFEPRVLEPGRRVNGRLNLRRVTPARYPAPRLRPVQMRMLGRSRRTWCTEAATSTTARSRDTILVLPVASGLMEWMVWPAPAASRIDQCITCRWGASPL